MPRTDDLVMIQLTLNEGRAVEIEKSLYKAIAEGLQKVDSAGSVTEAGRGITPVMTAAATAPTASTDVVTMAMIVLFLPSG